MSNINHEDIRSKIKMYLTYKNVKQVDLAMGINMTPAKLSAALNLNRKLEADELFKICDYMNVDPTTLRDFKASNR